MMTKITSAEYRPGFTHPSWEKILGAVPADVRDWLQVRLGQAITGYMTPDDRMVIYHGDGENGKSTVNEVTSRAIGDYFLMCPDRLLMANPDQHPTELMDLAGVRYAVAEETPEAARLSAQRLKKTLGTSTIRARRIRQDDVTFYATHSLFLSTNHRPLIAEVDRGTWRRLAMLTFPYTFHDDPAEVVGPLDRLSDPGLRDRAKGDPEVWAAALAWMVEGARRWYAAGRLLPPLPQRVVEDTKAWRSDNDLAMGYIEERLRFDVNMHVAAVDFTEDLNAWLEAHGQKPWPDKLVAERFRSNEQFKEHGVEKTKRRGNEGLSRPVWKIATGAAEPSGQYHRWEGVRFVTDRDHLEEEHAEAREEAAAHGFDPDDLDR